MAQPVFDRTLLTETVPIPPPFVFGSPAWTPPLARSAIAVGNFDGVHLGHAAIARKLRAVADAAGAPAVALTFDPHPASIVRPASAPVPLTTPDRRAELLLALGLDAVLVQPADASLVALPAETFYREILRDRLGGIAFVEGQDFRFGAGREGDVAMLKRLAAAEGASVDVVAPVTVDGEPVSSSRLRALIADGNVAAAASLATAPHRASGVVVEGARRGRTLGFPTANLASIATLLPAEGVYAARGAIAGDGTHRTWFPAAVNIGPAPTFGVATQGVEVHLIGYGGDCYGRVLDVDFLQRLRDTRRFASAEDLKACLANDVARALEIASASR
jgi:riboflavin kinase/FMN adenylyltransferase